MYTLNKQINNRDQPVLIPFFQTENICHKSCVRNPCPLFVPLTISLVSFTEQQWRVNRAPQCSSIMRTSGTRHRPCHQGPILTVSCMGQIYTPTSPSWTTHPKEKLLVKHYCPLPGVVRLTPPLPVVVRLTPPLPVVVRLTPPSPGVVRFTPTLPGVVRLTTTFTWSGQVNTTALYLEWLGYLVRLTPLPVPVTWRGSPGSTVLGRPSHPGDGLNAEITYTSKTCNDNRADSNSHFGTLSYKTHNQCYEGHLCFSQDEASVEKGQ